MLRMAEEILGQQEPRVLQGRREQRNRKLSPAEFDAHLDEIIADMNTVDGNKDEEEGKGNKGRGSQSGQFRGDFPAATLQTSLPSKSAERGLTRRDRGPPVASDNIRALE